MNNDYPQFIFTFPNCPIFKLRCTGQRIRTTINGFGDRYSTIELGPYNLYLPLTVVAN